jgi:hypothetical protein
VPPDADKAAFWAAEARESEAAAEAGRSGTSPGDDSARSGGLRRVAGAVARTLRGN